MNIREAAQRLNLSERHLRRLIKMGAIPAEKRKVMIEVEAWEIPDDAIQAADDALRELGRYDHFGDWMLEKADELGLTLQDLSKRTRVPLHILEEISRTPGWLKPEAEEIEQKIASALLRVTIQRRSGNVEQ